MGPRVTCSHQHRGSSAGNYNSTLSKVFVVYTGVHQRVVEKIVAFVLFVGIIALGNVDNALFFRT